MALAFFQKSHFVDRSLSGEGGNRLTCASMFRAISGVYTYTRRFYDLRVDDFAIRYLRIADFIFPSRCMPIWVTHFIVVGTGCVGCDNKRWRRHADAWDWRNIIVNSSSSSNEWLEMCGGVMKSLMYETQSLSYSDTRVRCHNYTRCTISHVRHMNDLCGPHDRHGIRSSHQLYDRTSCSRVF